MAATSNGRLPSSVPTSGGWPVLGHTVPFLRDAGALLEQQRARHGDVFGLSVLGQPTVAFLTPEATRTIYLDRERVFSSEIGWSFTIPRTPFPVQTHPGRR